MSEGFTCRGCGNLFLQDPKCVTCGAQKLYDSTVKIQGEQIRAQAAEITRLGAELATARREGMEEAAKIAEGEVYLERYRTWPWWKSYGTGNRSGNRAAESDVVIHCDAIAAAIRAAAGEMK